MEITNAIIWNVLVTYLTELQILRELEFILRNSFTFVVEILICHFLCEDQKVTKKGVKKITLNLRSKERKKIT